MLYSRLVGIRHMHSLDVRFRAVQLCETGSPRPGLLGRHHPGLRVCGISGHVQGTATPAWTAPHQEEVVGVLVVQGSDRTRLLVVYNIL